MKSIGRDAGSGSFSVAARSLRLNRKKASVFPSGDVCPHELLPVQQPTSLAYSNVHTRKWKIPHDMDRSQSIISSSTLEPKEHEGKCGSQVPHPRKDISSLEEFVPSPRNFPPVFFSASNCCGQRGYRDVGTRM